jgi:hypothetical protein
MPAEWRLYTTKRILSNSDLKFRLRLATNCCLSSIQPSIVFRALAKLLYDQTTSTSVARGPCGPSSRVNFTFWPSFKFM